MLLVEAFERVGQRDGEQPARGQVLAYAGKAARTALGPAEELQRLHRHEDEGEAAIDGEVARVGRDGGDCEARGAVAQGFEQLRAAVERHHLVAAAREVERDAPGARADVEHRRALAVGQLAPQRQVEVVAPHSMSCQTTSVRPTGSPRRAAACPAMLRAEA